MFFTCLDRVSSRYFILFDAIGNNVAFLISFSGYLPFVYRRATYFFFFFLESILYQATLMKMFITSRSSLVTFLGSLIYIILSSANKDSLTFSFSIHLPLISFSCLITLAKTSSTI
jgi:hypothetical protein